MNNFALLDIELEGERERVLFYIEIFGYFLEIKCGTWTEVQVLYALVIYTGRSI